MVSEMLRVNATKAVNLLETYRVRRLFSIEPINVSSPNLVKAMSCKLLSEVRSERLLTRISSSGNGSTVEAPWKYFCHAF